MKQEFAIHDRLLRGSSWIAERAGCHILWKDHPEFPWLLIVPEVPDSCRDWHEVDAELALAVHHRLRWCSAWLHDQFQPDKINIALIGNQVPQQHWHIVARWQSDSAWPGTVWAQPSREPDSARWSQWREKLRENLD